MTAEQKLYFLASQNTQLVSDLTGTNDIFQFFDTQLPPGYVQPPLGSVLTFERVSTIWQSNMGGTTPLNRIRFQFNIYDYDPQNGRNTTKDVIAWLNTVDLTSSNQFETPPQAAPQAPCLIINQRQTIKDQLTPLVWVQILDARIYNREDQ